MQKRGNVLIVDDDINLCETLKDILEEKGYFVTLVNNGEDAISAAKSNPQDIIFLDMRLPTLNGLQTYIATRKVDSKVTVVLMTAYQQEMKKCVEEALMKKAYACLYKPFDPKKVLGIIEEIMKEKTKKRG